ncbi:MAG: sensor histidine kinase [Phycisphaerales bacterium]
MPRRDLLALLPAGLLPGLSWGAASLSGGDGRAQGLALGIGTGLGVGVLLLYHAASARRIAKIHAITRRLLSQSSERQAPDDPRASIDDEASAGSLAQQLLAVEQRIETQVKDSAKKSRNLEALIDGLEEPVLAFGAQDAVIFCNRPAEAMMGVGPGRLVGLTVRELFTRAEIVSLHAQGKAGTVARAQVPIVSPAGMRTYQVSAAPLPPAWGEGRFGALLVLRDITELAQAVQMRTDFVANASHELRTPVSAIKIAADTLLDGAKDDPAMTDRLLGMVSAHASRLDEMVRDLMDLSRLESTDMPMRPGELDLDELRAALASTFEPALRQRRLQIAFELDPRLDWATTDPRLIQLVLRNLVDNATKYAREQTTIRVLARLLDAATPAPGTGTTDGPRTARFEVIDRGIGIPLSQQERVFERFFQADPARTGSTSGRGTGLGLAIVKHAARALGGRVGIDSIWGQGTTVWMEAPVSLAAPARAGDLPAADAIAPATRAASEAGPTEGSR